MNAMSPQTTPQAAPTEADAPMLHAGGAAHWDISQEVLNFIRTEVKPGSRTLETGAGASTVVFAEQGAQHECVTPSESEVAAITAACVARGVPAERITFRLGLSQDVLPKLTGPLDLVLIDGGHGFPIPAVDWLYTAPRLVVGGLMAIDDVDLWTGAMIVDFLRGEDCWKQESLLRGRTAVFRLTKPFELHEWTKQPTVVAKSRITQGARKAKNLLGLIASGNLGAIKGKLVNERRLAEAAKDDY
jgi:predicted O-methyltransferase YrrM